MGFVPGAHPARNGRGIRCCGAVLFGVALLISSLSAAQTRRLVPDTDAHFGKTCTTAGCHEPAANHDIPQHVPYLEGNCRACHEDHTSTKPLLLLPGGNALCLKCHTGLATTSGSSEVRHPPQANRCLDCHSPHQGRIRSLLRDENQLSSCAECHRDFLEAGRHQPYRHKFFEPRTQCGNCHYAHSRAEHQYLRPEVSETCLTCHDIPIRSANHQLENVARSLREKPVVHGAVKAQGCQACHTPHGSVQPSLLLAGYPAGEYKPYQTSDYALCWRCHNARLVEAPSDATATRFRNETKNLHYLHVIQLKRARACHLCHEAHASDVTHLLRQTTRFGQWNAELKWQELPDGGTCLTACHDQKRYTRAGK